MLHSVQGQNAHAGSNTPSDHSGSVDPFIGVDWGGNTFVGSAIPFGMVNLGPDMETFDGRRSGFGYSSHGTILGFSHLHLSGAQGKYGNILVAPVTGPLDLTDIKSPRSAEVNTLGYYRAQLSRYNVKAELTSSRRVGFHRYTFPASAQSHLTLNVASALGLGPGSESQRFLGAQLHVTSNHEAQGVARFAGGWNKGGEYDVYYYLVLDTPADAVQTWTSATLSPAKDASVETAVPIGASFDFKSRANQVVQVKVSATTFSRICSVVRLDGQPRPPRRPGKVALVQPGGCSSESPFHWPPKDHQVLDQRLRYHLPPADSCPTVAGHAHGHSSR
jgi:putative alpha-1,2-mannosidase